MSFTDYFRRHKTSLITAAVLVSLLLLFRALIGSDNGDLISAAEPLPVSVKPLVEESGFEVMEQYVGRIAARRESEVGFELPGAVASVAVEEGAHVAAGQVLATLDAQLLQAREQELSAALDQAQAQAALAASTIIRTQAAFEEGAVSAQVLDEAQAAANAAQASASAAEASLKSLRVQLEKSELRAPYAAQVARRYVDEGQVVAAGTALFRLLEDTALDVRLVVAANAAQELSEGQLVEISVNEQQLQGRVRSIFPEREGRTRGVAVLLEILNDEVSARAGDLATVSLPKRIDTSAYRLPLTALTESVRGIWAVYAAKPQADEAGQGWVLDRVQIEILYQQDDEVLVRGALGSGDLVVTSGLQRLVPGQEVRVRQEASANASNSALLGAAR